MTSADDFRDDFDERSSTRPLVRLLLFFVSPVVLASWTRFGKLLLMDICSSRPQLNRLICAALVNPDASHWYTRGDAGALRSHQDPHPHRS